MAAEDFNNLTSDQGLPPELDGGSPYTGNRPASGARRATPGEVLSQGFQGAENAGDFLGLDVEFAGSQGAEGFPGALDLHAPPSTQAWAPEEATSYAPAPLPAGDPVQEFAEAPSAFEFGEDLGTEDGEAALEGQAASSKKPLLVAAVLASALGLGGFFYGPELYTRFAGDSEPVASVPTPSNVAPDKSQPKTAASREPAPSKVDALGSAPVASPLGSDAASASEPRSVKVSRTSSPTPTPSASVEPDAVTEPSRSAQAETQGAIIPGDVLSQLLSATAGPGPSPSAFPDLAGAEYEWASSDQLELIWRGSEVPMEAIKAAAKTLLPRVGKVRVFTTAGDVFEGRLHAVGQNRVWLDTAPGRVGLDGAMVAHIEVLPPAPAGQQLTGDSALLAGGKRVRVRVPGGLLYGRVLKYEGESVTLVLDDGGGKVRVKAGELEDLGSRRAFIVSR